MTPARAWTSGWRAAALLLAAVALAYGNALSGPFQFDDWWAVTDRAATRDLAGWWASLPGIRPLLKLSYALNATLSPAPWHYHLANVGVHAGNAWLVLALLRALLPRLAPRSPDPAFAAFAAALLFALHPAATEAVTYVSGRSVSLAALPWLAALLCLVRGAGDPGARRWPWMAALFFALALGVRETAAILPLAWAGVVACAGWPWRPALRALLPSLGVLAAAAAAALATPGYASFFSWSLRTRGPLAQALGQLEAQAYFLSGPLPGLALNIDPDLRVPAGPGLAHAAVLAAFLALAALAARQWRARPWIAFAFGLYLLALAPTNSVLPRFDLANDRHLYLALLAPALALGLGLAALRPRAAGLAALALVAGLAGTATHRRNADYASELALWTATVRASPQKARPWTNLGFARQQAGDDAGARAAYHCALRVDPAYRPARWNLAALGPDPGPPPAACPPP